MRFYLKMIALSACLFLAAASSIHGAVVLIDPSSESPSPTLVKSVGLQMPKAHGPVLELPNAAVILRENPAVLDQPMKTGNLTSDTSSAGFANVSDAAPLEPKAGDEEEKQKPRLATEAEADKIAAEQKKSPSQDDKAAGKTQESKKTTPSQPMLQPLSSEMEALRKNVRQVLNYYSRRPLNTRDNTAAHVLKACLAFGCDAQVRQGGSTGETINGFTCLCWNYPCGGYNLLKMVDGHIAARVGYGLQSNQSEFLATLALARVPSDYPLRVGKTVRSVADLVEAEKLACRSGQDLSFKLVGLARYLPSDASWKNSLGQRWTIQRMLKQELDRVGQADPCGGTYRLLAISYAIDRRAKSGMPLDGQYSRGKKFIDKYQAYALALQNSNGSWHPNFFKHRGEGGSTIGQINSTGHIMSWLVLSLPREKLSDPCIARSISFLADRLTSRRLGSLASTSAAEIDARMTAIHALNEYNRRMFGPYDKAAQEAAAAAEAAKQEAAAEQKAAVQAEISQEKTAATGSPALR